MDTCTLCQTSPGHKAFMPTELRKRCQECADFMWRAFVPMLTEEKQCFCRLCISRAETACKKIEQLRERLDSRQSTSAQSPMEIEASVSEGAPEADETAEPETVKIKFTWPSGAEDMVVVNRDIAQALAAKNEAEMVRTMWTNATIRECMISKVAVEADSECCSICTATSSAVSPFFINEVERLSGTCIRDAYAYLKDQAPVTSRLLQAVGKKSRLEKMVSLAVAEKRKQQSVVLAASVLLKDRNKNVSTIQLLLGLVLRHCGLNTRGVSILAAFNVISSVSSLREKRRPLASKSDQQVQCWKYEIETRATISRLLEIYTGADFGGGLTELKDGGLRADTVRKIVGGDRPELVNKVVATIDTETRQCATSDEFCGALSRLAASTSPRFGLVVDNIDLVGKAAGEHHIRHWTNAMAILEKPVDNTMSNLSPYEVSATADLTSIPRSQLLPTISDMQQLKASLVVLWERIVVKQVPCFAAFENLVCWHIPHRNEREARTAATYDILGVVPYDESHTAEMVKLVEEMQIRFVPCLNGERICTTYFHGDQKTEKMAIVAQNARLNSDTAAERLELVSPVFALFHLQMNLLKMHCQDFVKRMSVGEKGTVAQLAALCGHANTEKNPEKYYFEVYNMVEFYAQCGIVAATLAHLDCTSFDDAEQKAAALFAGDTEENAATFQRFCIECVDRFLKPITLLHVLAASDEVAVPDSSVQHCDDESDGVFNYSTKWLLRSMMLLVLNDAIREGDCDRIETSLKLFLPLLHKRRHEQYANCVLRLLTFTSAIASPAERDRLLSNMTTNWKGRPGHCTAVDWRLERANDFIKKAVKSLGANATTEAAVEISRCVKPLMQLQDSLEEELSLDTDGGYRRRRYPEKDRKRDVATFLAERLFSPSADRPSLPSFKFTSASVYEGIDVPKFWSWILNRLKADQRSRRIWKHFSL